MVEFKAPYFSKGELRTRAEEFLAAHNPSGEIPVPIEHIVEMRFGMDIVPVPGLQAGFDIVGFLTNDMQEIRVDEYVYLNRLNRYRFSLAHELAHRILHAELWRQMHFNDIASWKTAVTQSIAEKEYGFVEFHANFFAGLILVPTPDLETEFRQCVAMARQQGLDIHDEATGAQELVESYIGRAFDVSRDVIHKRLETERLWACPE